MSLGFISINSYPSVEVRFQKEMKPIPKKREESSTGGLTVKDNDNIFIETCAKKTGSVLYGKTMGRSTRKSLNANWYNSSADQKEEEK